MEVFENACKDQQNKSGFKEIMKRKERDESLKPKDDKKLNKGMK